MSEPVAGGSTRSTGVPVAGGSTGSTGLPDAIYRKSLDCVHCGLCLSSCPTYLATGREISSPRGRIYLMRGVAEGRIELGDLATEAYLCLGCRACETACPSGVEFGSMLEETRERVDAAGLRAGWRFRLERFLLRQVVARPLRLHALVSILGAVQSLGLDRLVLPLLPRSIREAHALMPAIPAAGDRRALPRLTPAEGERRGRVAFFAGCIMPEIFGDVNRATVRVLARNGFDVLVPPEWGCCGALHAHTGDVGFARRLASANVRRFAAGRESVDAIVVNSAGCGAALREIGHWLPGEGERYAAKIRDVAEFLDDVGLRPPNSPVRARVCYDDPCHLIHGQRVVDAPRRLLRQIEGLELVAHRNPDRCCGAAGIYNLTHPEMSRSVLDAKLDALQEARPDVIATGNPGCLMQLRSGVRSRGLPARVVHPIELLDQAYQPRAAI